MLSCSKCRIEVSSPSPELFFHSFVSYRFREAFFKALIGDFGWTIILCCIYLIKKSEQQVVRVLWSYSSSKVCFGWFSICFLHIEFIPRFSRSIVILSSNWWLCHSLGAQHFYLVFGESGKIRVWGYFCLKLGLLLPWVGVTFTLATKVTPNRVLGFD